MENRSTALLVGVVLAGLIAPVLVVVIIMTAVQDEVDDCAPTTGTPAETGTGMVASLSGPMGAPGPGQVGVAQANIPARSGAAGFARSVPRVLASRPDFVSLNEQFGRSLAQIEAAAPGYEAYRDPTARGQGASTVVLWETGRWDRVDAGRRVLVPRGPQRWDAGRSATYLTARATGAAVGGGRVVSVVSVHHMVNPAKVGPAPGVRRRIYAQGMDRLTALVEELGRRGPVFVAGDMNTHAAQASAPWSAAAKMDAAGFGWVETGVDFVFYPQDGGIRPAGAWRGSMASDHDWLAARFTMAGARADTGRPARAAAAATSSTSSTSPNGATGSATGSGVVRTVAGLSAEQTRNAATIVAVGRDLGVAQRGLVVALATALQESGLRNLDGGDRDSLGLFQQRPSTGWGTPAQIRDPQLAAHAFYGDAEHTANPGLLDVPGWEQMSVAAAAQAVQRSAFPSAYADDEDLAGKVLAQLDPDAAAQVAAATAPSYCAQGATAAGMVGAGAASCAPTDSSAEAGLRPDGLLVLRCVAGTFGSHTFGGVGERASNSASDHPSGKAVDVMIDDWASAAGVAEGDAIAAWLQAHQRELGITYLIWRGRIWSAGDGNVGPGQWRAYSHPSGATDPTSRHMDHVHVSVEGDAGTGIRTGTAQVAGLTGGVGGAVVVPLPAGTYTDLDNWRKGGSRWANWHSGDDLSAPCGTPVLAAHAGTVEIDTDQAWAGPRLVKVSQGPRQVSTWYAHMATTSVTAGQQVAAGQQIGTVGSEGNSTGCHLHLEVHTRNGGIYAADNTDPMAWIRSQSRR